MHFLDTPYEVFLMQPSARTIALTIGAWLVCLASQQAWSAAGAEPAATAKPTAKAGAKAEPAKTEQPAQAAEAVPEVDKAAPAHAEAKGSAGFPVINSIYILMLAGFVGFEVIGRVSPLLHTPLMSATNAISGISLVGSVVAAGSGELGTVSHVLGFIAVTAATINVVGGFMITDRMLRMFKLRGKEKHG
jgi:H+-translocating NAD(P) transhydrogenase subunit alpha